MFACTKRGLMTNSNLAASLEMSDNNIRIPVSFEKPLFIGIPKYLRRQTLGCTPANTAVSVAVTEIRPPDLTDLNNESIYGVGLPNGSKSAIVNLFARRVSWSTKNLLTS